MESIRLLDDNTINKIAAGEVVERPSSVIKELLENSIDANSTAITIEITDGGKSYIRITDNGDGISKEDIELAFLRHSTSKISQAEDLCCVETLGFRGEALASISAVSQVELITKTSTDEVGVKAIVHGGTLKSKEEIGCPDGTTMIIRNLFYNTPVRQKFLKSDSTEAGHIGDIVYKLALSNPGISFNYIKDNRSVIKTPGRGDLKTTAYSILGGDFVESTFEIKNASEGMSLYGFIGKPEYTRSNRNGQYLFINGRYIKDIEISKIIEQSYSTLLTIKRYPVFLLFIDIETEKVDINVHPTKTEVRFTNRDLINKFLFDSVKDVLYSKNLIPKVTFSEPSKKIKKSTNSSEEQVILDTLPNSATTSSNIDKQQIDEQHFSSVKSVVDRIDKLDYVDKSKKSNESSNDNSNKTLDIFDGKSFKPDNTDNSANNVVNKDLNKDNNLLQVVDYNLIDDDNATKDNTDPLVTLDKSDRVRECDNQCIDRKNQYIDSKTHGGESLCNIYDETHINRVPEIVVIGNLFKTYILGQDINNKIFYMIDQHAAHERVMYEKLKSQFLSQGVSTQMLIATDVLELSLSDMDLIKNNIEVFKDLGFEIEDFGTNTMALRGVPLVFGNPTNSKKLFLDILDNLESGTSSNYELQLDRIMKLACTSAIKANDDLEDIEVDRLIDDLRQTKEPFTCPHGRPIIIEMTKTEIEKKFKRI